MQTVLSQDASQDNKISDGHGCSNVFREILSLILTSFATQ